MAAVIWQRARLAVTLVGVGWLVLAGRLIQLQWFERQELSERAEQQRIFVEEIAPRPGDIFDRQGRLLATSVQTRSLYLVPNRIANPWTVAQRLEQAISVPAETLFERLGSRADRQFLWAKRRLSHEEVDRVRQLDLEPGTWGFREEYQREYPQGTLAAQVLGLRDIDGIGRGGIEEGAERELRGKTGKRLLMRDARGRVLDVLSDVDEPPLPGESIRLTIDIVVQLFAERELDQVMANWKPESCCAVVMNPKNGDVLAMASRPTFDPNRPEEAKPDAWTNRTIADIYEPGSTFKPFVVAYGLDQGVLKPDDAFYCEHGEYRMGRRLLHDHHPYGTLSLTDVLVKSSNIGMAKIGERMQNPKLFEAARLFGFGRKTGIELPGELPGILRPLTKWNAYSTGSVPMGHEIAATPLQLITAHAALANGGQLPTPRLILGVDADATQLQSLTHDTVRAETSRWLIEHPMSDVVSRGTGKRARLPGYRVFGKTGTAQCLSPSGGYVSGKYVSSFLCGAPVEDPQILVLVVVNQATVGSEAFGGKVAAPAAANILRQALVYLRVSPDAELMRHAADWESDAELQ
jgi:cell division protein FtsI (penicillin-binding protein 3)